MSLTALFDVPAPAKLNLFLHVLGRRADGYHLLQSVFVLIDWCDMLHFEKRGDGQLSRADLGPALPDDDLCLRAARLLQQQSGCTLGAHISIDKRVPWGAGLGGGSSDAASTLLALNRLWRLHWPRERLLTLALQLGADVPFFVRGHNAWVEGIGEIITPIELPSAAFAVLKPSMAVPTAAVFASPLLSRNTPPAIVADFLADPFGFGRNDLQAAAAGYAAAQEANAVQPAKAAASDREGLQADTPNDTRHAREGIDTALELLAKAFGSSRMTGSGSAVFAYAGRYAGNCADTQASADRLDRLMATAAQDLSGRLCHSLPVHPLRDWTAD